jgi:hypothetical protein
VGSAVIGRKVDKNNNYHVACRLLDNVNCSGPTNGPEVFLGVVLASIPTRLIF